MTAPRLCPETMAAAIYACERLEAELCNEFRDIGPSPSVDAVLIAASMFAKRLRSEQEIARIGAMLDASCRRLALEGQG